MKKTNLAVALLISVLSVNFVLAEQKTDVQAEKVQTEVTEKYHHKHHYAHCGIDKMPNDKIHAPFHGMSYQHNMHNFHQWHPKVTKGFYTSLLTTVVDAEKWQDDQTILLEGNIIKQVGKKQFVFKDQTGEITLEIRAKAWHGVISPEDKVKVVVEVEKSWGKTELEAISVRKVKVEKEKTVQAE